jgi:hypothetical protein
LEPGLTAATRAEDGLSRHGRGGQGSALLGLLVADEDLREVVAGAALVEPQHAGAIAVEAAVDEGEPVDVVQVAARTGLDEAHRHHRPLPSVPVQVAAPHQPGRMHERSGPVLTAVRSSVLLVDLTQEPVGEAVGRHPGSSGPRLVDLDRRRAHHKVGDLELATDRSL